MLGFSSNPSVPHAGLPPSWARRQNAESPRPNLDTSRDDDLVMETWRRKYLWFPVEIGEDGLGYPILHWPPYYGSWSKTRLLILNNKSPHEINIFAGIDHKRHGLLSSASSKSFIKSAIAKHKKAVSPPYFHVALAARL